MRAYLAAPIFTERDRNFNTYLEHEILSRCPDLDLYLAQNNATINDKSQCATSADIYVGDITRLKEADLLITVMSGDLPPIGSSYEVAYYCALCEQDPRRKIIALYDDCREGYHTYSESKKNAMISSIGENQWPYINLLSVGFVKKWGTIYHTSKELIDAVYQAYSIGADQIISGIYKITNLKNNLIYIGQSKNIYNRWLYHKRGDESSPLADDVKALGIDYFKFEVIEKCDESQLDDREKYWIDYYDSYNTGYNRQSGGSGDKSRLVSDQCVPVYAYNLDGVFAQEFYSVSSASRTIGLKSYGDISRCAAMNDSAHQSGGFMWRYYKVDKIEPYNQPSGPNAKKVYAYDINTREFVTEYETAIQAGIELTGKRQAHICDVASGKRKSCAGFIWAYDLFDRLPANYFDI